MHTLPLFVLDGWSGALMKSNPGSCKLLSSHEISELRKALERHKMSTLLLEIKPCKALIFGSCVQEYYLDSSDKLKDFDPAHVSVHD